MILIVGGAGYIGSHTNKLLSQKNYKTLVLDNLVSGHREFIKWGEFLHVDLENTKRIDFVFKKYNIQAVIHFAAYAYVEESLLDPKKYYRNNVGNTINLLETMIQNNCKYFIFSSSCATYGNPLKIPIDEKHPQNPINPYGKTKWIVEQILQDYSLAYDLKYVSLRYFNASGADFDIEIGENHNPETHLIPLVLDAAIGKKKDIKVYGKDYDTCDGTAIRDYIHVCDLANAHLLALNYLISGGKSETFNLGNGKGYSVLDVINIVKFITKKNFTITYTGRRTGDPARLICDSSKAKAILGWVPQYPSLEEIISSAWNWHLKLNKQN